MSVHCTHHCAACGAHFTSLRAFDLHREDGGCTFPDHAPLVDLIGVCAIADYDEDAKPIRREGVVVYQLTGAVSVREYFAGVDPGAEGVESAHTPPVQRKSLAGVA
jgi:hypothetical protein